MIKVNKSDIKNRVVKEAAPHSLLLIYILHIDLIRNVMHNIHTLMYIHNSKPFHILTYILYTPWAYDPHLRLFLN